MAERMQRTSLLGLASTSAEMRAQLQLARENFGECAAAPKLSVAH